MKYYAHTIEGLPEERWQPLETHLQNVADLSSRRAQFFAANNWGYLLGRLHDIGKYRPEFQKKLVRHSNRQVDHKSVGARLVHNNLGDAGKLLSYCIAGHHGGLPNYGHSSTDGSSSLQDLLEEASTLPDNIESPLNEIEKPELPFSPHDFFQFAFFTRMLFSSLVDADFLDTEAFLDPEKANARTSSQPLEELLSCLNAKLAQLSTQGRINQLRNQILDHCRSNASMDQGLFTMTVPTGGGKTLSSMAFALDHAIKHDLRRIIYVIPYTSIIEQNAKIFRDIFPEGSVIEHHSNFDEQKLNEEADQSGEGLRHRLACENWDAPVVVTTNVQFFESLFAAGPSRCRKLHNIAGSVIILDEAQMLPVHYLNPCIRALKELSGNYNCSVVLCTATQPALSQREDFPDGIEGLEDREIAPDPELMHKEFVRTRFDYAGTLPLVDVAEIIRHKDQVLAIVNTRSRATELFDLVGGEEGVYHLTALMCPAHRAEKLEEIKYALSNGEYCRVVSTQLVEAGVDISFPEVIREMAGLDSIAQAAGRCNREGEMEDLGNVIVFTPEEGVARVFKQAAGNTQTTLRHYNDDPFSPEAIEYFFAETYWLSGPYLDNKNIMEEFTVGPKWPFRDVANKFRFIENDMLPVIIPWNDEANDLIEDLRYADVKTGILRSLQKYIVQVYRHQLSILDRAGALELVGGSYPVLIDDEYYCSHCGLIVNERTDGDPGWIV